MPGLNTANLSRLHSHHFSLLRVFTVVSTVLDQKEPESAFGTTSDNIDADDEFSSQSSRVTSSSILPQVPRSNNQLSTSPRTFYVETKRRLALLRAIQEDSSQIGLLPAVWITEFLSMTDDDLLYCRALLLEITYSDLVVGAEDALDIIQRLGAIISASDYQYCEVALTTCLDVLNGLHSTWLNDSHDLGEAVGDLYNYFIKVCLPSNLFSARARISMARLLFTLLGANPSYGTNLDLDSCRTSLLSILSSSVMQVKCFIAEKIADVFELFVLMLHDEIFVDVLASLPTNPDDASGIAFRLWTLSKLACRWPTLLRRCIYHIFEAPGKIVQAMEYAKWCLTDISKALDLKSAVELFQLFSRQLLYTWMEHDPIQDMPFSIFGFKDLGELLQTAQAEASALAIMRVEKAASVALANTLGLSESDLIKKNFATVLSYSMAYGDAFGDTGNDKGENYIKNVIGHQAYTESIHINFVDIIAALFDLIDQEDHVEKILRKYEAISYAADNLERIKKFSHSANELPPNQQPMFRAKYIIHVFFRLCQRTEYEFQDIWAPALVLAVTRQLFNTVHPALGPLHACSVLRKVRLVVCLAGSVVLESYCLEMLLNSIRGFMVDPEGADDALGLSQYLLSGGSQYLCQRPSFVAGYALSTLASLRVFLESSQSSTTQEKQFKATMNKAQKFHDWFSEYLSGYTSKVFRNDAQLALFKSVTHSAALITSSGNAEKGTSESKLLLDILKDDAAEHHLLNESSRALALKLLCGDFTIPETVARDIIDTDDAAVDQAPRVWKSCEAHDLSKNYLSWAGRVIGRSFAATGHIPQGVLEESDLCLFGRIAPGPNGSDMGLLYLLQDLTADQNSEVAGLSEAALRTAVSRAIAHEDEALTVACQRSLSESLFTASQWGGLRSPPSEIIHDLARLDEPSVWEADVSSSEWLRKISTYLVSTASESILLSSLPSIVAGVTGFAERAFPFLVHSVLCFQLEQHQTVKKKLSLSLKEWLQNESPKALTNLKLLINTILYLRTQEYPRESSIADRLHWLDVEYTLAARAASRCGMHKTGLLFAELVSSDTSRSSRSSSLHKEPDLNVTLLTIFENIDDPDTYYGLPEDASLCKVLARVEYENEGSKSLAFRGAQYDSHLRLRRKAAEADGLALVKALGTLGLSGLSHSVLQRQESAGTNTSSIESTFSTARRLEMWNLPAPGYSSHHAVILYQVYQSIHNSTELSAVREAIHNGYGRVMQAMGGCSLNATAVRSRLAALAALTELDDMFNISELAEIEGLLEKFRARSEWMRSGM
ncbi:hypothetical protein UVI_02037950 [Ustilaginoidea virens]|uniref:Uncharacterized protein n=1 Tax=Ustilaginoidea virens TaxID=1159556 RepID=A0A1B5KT76_USTVR|nr:hypothetical protein UVI_02037950 [Ustilaginoidea virens]